jgi:RecA-family ATPase
VHWSFELPRIGTPSGLRQMAIDIAEKDLKVVFVDPLYLSLLGGTTEINAGNMYQMGPLLQEANQVCDELGCTLVLLHHTRKTTGKQPLQLQDLAYTGIQQFARQWILINRQEPFDAATGQSKLWVSAGGASGHSGCYSVDINEGILQGGNLLSRKWEVCVQSRTDHLAQHRTQKQEVEAEQLDRDWKKIQKFLNQHPEEGETRRQIELHADLSRARVKKIVEMKVASRNLIMDVCRRPAGHGHKDQTVYKLSPPFSCLVDAGGDVESMEEDVVEDEGSSE